MRHKYATTGIVLARTPISEASALLAILTPDFGLVRARVQGIRKPGAKLAPALQTLVESDVILVKGKEGWRLSGAVLGHDWFSELTRPARMRAGRTTGLLLRLVHGELSDPRFFSLYQAFLYSLTKESRDDMQDAAECLAVLRFLQMLGFDAGDIPGELSTDFNFECLEDMQTNRSDMVARINRGIASSGL